MAAILSDITFYYSGILKNNKDDHHELQKILNFISDFYHHFLNGYKPPKTGRITLHVGPSIPKTEPGYFGSICIYYKLFDDSNYLKFNQNEKFRYVLDLIHNSILELSDIFNWEKIPFINSYELIIAKNFKFEKIYPQKQSRNGELIGQVKLLKTLEKSILTIEMLQNEMHINKILLEKSNTFWGNSIYEYAKNTKWLSNSNFGFKSYGRQCYYSIENEDIFNDLLIGENGII